MVGETDDRAAILRPYLPRLAIEWLAEHPHSAYREIDGTLAFVDISGFTKLSERLARHGKVGAEELTETIGACFAELLEVAYAVGGSLIKFGGDALLILFRGDDHAVRACGAALGMRAALRRIGDIVTPGGRVRLRMSVGVHTGTFHFFLVGEDHRELIVTGPAASQTTLMEQTADAGQIVISPETAAFLPARSLGARKGPGVLLRNAPEAVDPGIDPIPEDFDPTPSIPVAIREHVLGGGGDPEHRQACVIFMRFEGSDDVIANDGPAGLAERLAGLVTMVQRAAAAYGVTFLGSDIDRNGGKIILAAGAPRATGADDEAALLAARAILESGPPLSLRIGVNRGHVFAGDIGPRYRRTYTVMGDTVNLAARLMAAAEPGAIYATHEVLERSRTPFSTSPLEPFMVKGKSQPVQAAVVGPTAAEPARVETTADVPFIGRQREITALLEALEEARDRRGRAIEVIGDPGMGASRLIEEVRSRAAGLKVVTTTGGPYAQSTAYFPFRSFLRELIGIRAGLAPSSAVQSLRARADADAPDLVPWLPLLGAVIDLPIPATPQTEALDDEFRRAQLERVTVDFLGVIQRTPALFVFEDVHYFDEASAALLRAMVAASEAFPWLILITRRAGRGSRIVTDQPNARTVSLAPLEDATAAELVIAATQDAPPSEHELATLVKRAGGNPLFLHELIKAWHSARNVDELPDSVETLMTARIDNLPPSDRDVLRAAAVLGTAFDGSLLPAVLQGEATEDETIWRRLSDYIRRDARGWFRFTNVLIRDAAYEQLTYRRRAALHAATGDWILARGDSIEEVSELLALHFFHAQRWPETWRFARMAGERAQAKFANVEAAAFFERALEAARRLGDVPPDDVIRVREALGDVLNNAGEFTAAELQYRAARRVTTGDAVTDARLILKEALVADHLGRTTHALRRLSHGRKLLDALHGGDAARQRAQFAVWYAALRQGQGRKRDAVRWARRAIDEASASADHEALAHAHQVMNWACEFGGEIEGDHHGRTALRIYEELGDLRGQSAILNNLGAMAYFHGRWDEAVTLYERGRIACEQMGDPVNAAYGIFNVAEILSDQGRLDEAEPMLRHALRTWRAAGDVFLVSLATSQLARVAARSGRFDESLLLYEQARSGFATVGDTPSLIETDGRVAECLVLQGKAREALVILKDAIAADHAEHGVTAQTPLLFRVRGHALGQLGDLRASREAFETSFDAARDRNADYEVALTLRALATLDERENLTVGDASHRSEAILARLGVIAVADPPSTLGSNVVELEASSTSVSPGRSRP